MSATEQRQEYCKNRNKRKKKNARFMHNAKGFAKQGIYGRGTHIEDDQFQYFINILDAMKTGFEEVDEKVTMANNVFEQTKEQEIHLACNQIVSKALESLIGFTDAEHLERFFNAFAENLRPLCSDRFASHVLQKMVEIAFLRALGKDKLQTSNEQQTMEAKRIKVNALNEEHYNLQTEFSAAHKQKCAEFVQRIGKFLLNNLEDFVWDACANHIMRTCILCLAGVHVNKVAFERNDAALKKNRQHFDVPEQWIEVLQEFPQRLQMWPQFADFAYDDHAAALLAVICIALKRHDKSMLKKMGRKLLLESFVKVNDDDEDEAEQKKTVAIDDEQQQAEKQVEKTGKTLPKVFAAKSALMLLESLITLAGPKLLTQLYAMLFKGHLSQLALEQQSNFAVQKLLQNIKEKEDFEQIFTELAPQLEQFLKVGHTGVVSALAEACLRLGCKQLQMLNALQTALHLQNNKEKQKMLFQCLLKLKPHEILAAAQDNNNNFVHLHGSLMVQHILNYNKPILLVTCILDTTPAELANIFNTPNGSHIADAFLHSKFIGEKSRERLIRLLDGFYVDLAINKFGSHVLEHLFAAAQEPQKARIVKELADKSNMLKGTPFGRVIHSKLRVDTYRLSAEQWLASWQQQNKAAKLFQDILE